MSQQAGFGYLTLSLARRGVACHALGAIPHCGLSRLRIEEAVPHGREQTGAWLLLRVISCNPLPEKQMVACCSSDNIHRTRSVICEATGPDVVFPPKGERRALAPCHGSFLVPRVSSTPDDHPPGDLKQIHRPAICKYVTCWWRVCESMDVRERQGEKNWNFVQAPLFDDLGFCLRTVPPNCDAQHRG